VAIRSVSRDRIRHWGELVRDRDQRQKLARDGQERPSTFGVLHWDIKLENIIRDLATGQ
ncbi:unnamed protein product, partial [Coccothraustes coccothraustes]